MSTDRCASWTMGLLFGASVLAAGPAQASTLINGSFEVPVFADNPAHYVHLNGNELTGWTSASNYRGTVLFNSLYDPVTDGNQAVQIEVPGDWISQSFPTTVGTQYRLKFDLMAYRAYGGPGLGRAPCPCVTNLDVSAGTFSTRATSTSAGYLNYSFDFSASASTTTVVFKNPAEPAGWGNYPQLDKVSVTAVPQPGTSLRFQGVAFTARVSGNVFDVEIDAAGRSGDWRDAKYIDSIQLNDIGVFSSFTMGGDGAGWTPSNMELNADGCAGGSNRKRACAQGTPVLLADDMHFQFAFDDEAVLDPTAAHLKVRFLDEDYEKVGSLLSQPIPEPSTYALMLAGLAGLGLAARRRKT